MEKITYRLTWQDFKALERYLRSKSLRARLIFWVEEIIKPVGVITALLIALPVWDRSHQVHTRQDKIFLFCAFWVIWIAYKAYVRWSIYKNLKRAGLFDHDSDFQVSDAGVWHRGAKGEGTTFWNAIKEVLDYRDHIFFVLSDQEGIHLIPKRSFLTFEEASAFHQQALSMWKKYRNR